LELLQDSLKEKQEGVEKLKEHAIDPKRNTRKKHQERDLEIFSKEHPSKGICGCKEPTAQLTRDCA
jgi:hypothetical protein